MQSLAQHNPINRKLAMAAAIMGAQYNDIRDHLVALAFWYQLSNMDFHQKSEVEAFVSVCM